MEYTLTLRQRYLWLPIAKGQPRTLLEIFVDGEKKLEFNIPFREPDGADYIYDFYAAVRCGELDGRQILMKGELPESFFGQIRQSEGVPAASLSKPEAHFCARTGWINDPNGLVYRDGFYHLYFQYNLFDTEWDNMSWGHARSRDLLHWEQRPSVLYPDGDGMMFSGCGLCNTRGCLGLPGDALLFFYSAAGDANPWSRGKDFVQKLAYSLDGGETLIKAPDWILPTVSWEENGEKVYCRENRDPKVFWHEPSGSYVMVLWLRDNEFGILTSPDLEEFTLRQRLTLDKAWECPDLLCLPVEGSAERRWIFWSADGFYYLGDFDGNSFKTDGKRLEAYATRLPYAAQTFSGTEGRCVSIPWLRTGNPGAHYRGVMGLPRELSLRRTASGLRLVQQVVREWREQRRELFFEEDVSSLEYSLPAGTHPEACGGLGPLEVECLLDPGVNLELDILYTKICLRSGKRTAAGDGLESGKSMYSGECTVIGKCTTSGECTAAGGGAALGERAGQEACILSVGEESVGCAEELRELSVIFDGEIIEITGNGGSFSAAFERKQTGMDGLVRLHSDAPVTVHVFELAGNRE